MTPLKATSIQEAMPEVDSPPPIHVLIIRYVLDTGPGNYRCISCVTRSGDTAGPQLTETRTVYKFVGRRSIAGTAVCCRYHRIAS